MKTKVVIQPSFKKTSPQEYLHQPTFLIAIKSQSKGNLITHHGDKEE